MGETEAPNAILAIGTEVTAVNLAMGEITFAIFFLVEVLLKMISYRWSFFLNKDASWNMFDLILVLISFIGFLLDYVVETAFGFSNVNFMRQFRVLRIIKPFRMIRAMRMFTDLRLILDCILGSAVTLFWCACVIGFVLYVAGVYFVQVAALHLEEQGLRCPSRNMMP